MKQLVVIAIAAIVLVGCKKKFIIPENDMVTIVTQIFLSDALTLTAPVDASLFNRDSIEYYAHIYLQLGYSAAQFDSSVVYYTKNPVAFDRIIDKAISELSRMETEMNTRLNAINKPDSLSNIYDGKQKWLLPADGKTDSIGFRIPINSPGKYILSASLRVLPNDESIEPGVVFGFVVNNKNTYASKKVEPLKKDGIVRTIRIENSIADSSVTHLAGAILAHQPRKGDWSKSAEVFSICITFEPAVASNTVISKNRTRVEKPQ